MRDSLITAIAPIAWGTTYFVTTEFLPPDRPLLVGALRALPIGVLLAVVFRRAPAGVWWWRALVLGTLNVGLVFALLFTVAYRLPGGVAGTIAAVQPFLVVLLAWAVLGERPSTRAVLAACAGFAGVTLLILAPTRRLDTIGIAAAFCGSVAMAGGTVLTQRWGRPAPLLLFTAWQLVAGGLMLAVLAFVFEGPLPPLTNANLLSLVYLGVVGTGLAYVVWFRGIERISASAAAFLLLLVPVVAALLDVFVLKKRMTVLQTLGAAIVLVSIVCKQTIGAGPRPDR